MKEHRRDCRFAQNQNGKRKVVVVIREVAAIQFRQSLEPKTKLRLLSWRASPRVIVQSLGTLILSNLLPTRSATGGPTRRLPVRRHGLMPIKSRRAARLRIVPSGGLGYRY
jgi:hypothetical protein